MKSRLNKLVETVSNLPSNRLEYPTLILSFSVFILSLVVIFFCLNLPIPEKTPEGIHTQSLGKLLWKFRTNR